MSFNTDAAPQMIERLYREDRLSIDEKNNINLLVLHEGETPDLPMMQFMRTLPQWYKLVSAGDLVQVIEHKRITVKFQPIVSLRERSVYGYECLSRGLTADGDVIPPDKLFPQAKSLGLLFNLDRIARENAIQTAARHGVTDHIFINLLPAAIYDPEYCLRTTVAVAEESGLDYHRLVFEIVESERFGDVDHLKTILRHYRARGVKTALDDVGSGYSSLNTLAELQPDIMKLDMGLIRDIAKDSMKQSILTGLEQIARDNGILLLAAGVETDEELNFRKGRDIDLMQGYRFSPPRDEPDYVFPEELS